MSPDELETLRRRPEVASSCWLRDEADKPSRDVALAAGLQWLLRTEQPEPQALCFANGVVVHAQGRRFYDFKPQGPGGGTTMVSVHVHKVEHDMDTLDVLNPLAEGEGAEVAAALAALGATVTSSWGGTDFQTFALAEDTHPSLRAAVGRHTRGCPYHPARGTLCECSWYRTGADLLKLPDVDSVPGPGV
ncbi:hypothetical protein [Streptomyces violaceusniger]|uniref:Uncharacterized protein n=1 Tax=Streptomyces violaceusniger (strain Tu 4113) TaxID=653045 RepID=G2PHV9_STRV4|nr:hypothetical protein [Streptomyces violaceusniger]AEM88910.1 hypothetical protein Strvi_0135 [Streptomyces violaceusniger Tu 4113]